MKEYVVAVKTAVFYNFNVDRATASVSGAVLLDYAIM